MTAASTPTAVDLIALLGDADRDVRLRAVLELGETGYAPAATALVERFGVERDFYIRETLTWAVLRVREAALPLVHEALASPRWLARLQAVHTLSKVASPDDGERLLPLVADPVDAVAARAWAAAALTGDARVIPALAAQLTRGTTEHQNTLTVALGSFGASVVPALVGALRGGSPEVRRHAADTLSNLGSPGADGAVRALADAVGDPVEDVRLAALNALGQLVVPVAWEVIDGATQSPEPRLRHLAGRLTERRPTARALRMADLRQRAAGPAAPGAVDKPYVNAGPWPVPDPALVTLEGGAPAAELAPKLALQVEVCRPRYLSRADVPPEVLAQVADNAAANARAAGWPPSMAARIGAGAVEQFLHETVLLEQVSVANPGTTVANLLLGTGIRITGFARPPRPASRAGDTTSGEGYRNGRYPSPDRVSPAG